MKGPSSGSDEDGASMESGLPLLLEKLLAERGWDFRGYKKTSLTRRVTKRLQANGLSSVDDYVRLIEADPSEYQKLFSCLTIKVSEFFREPEVFDALCEILRTDFSATPLRAWCCASACGEEAYSLAILLSECLGIDALASSKVFATDIDQEALEYGRHAVYRAESMQNVTPEIMERYFIRTDGQFKVKYTLRNIVKFGTLDIVRNPALSGMHIVFCRNLFIYFDKALQEKVFHKLDYALKPGGVLALGKAEVLPHQYFQGYTPVGKGLNLFRKKG